MPVPWLTVGNLVLGNLDRILAVVRPPLTKRKIEALDKQTDLLNQQIAELQVAAAANTEQIRLLAAQLKDVVSALEQVGTESAHDRAVTRRLAYGGLILGCAGLGTGILALALK